MKEAFLSNCVHHLLEYTRRIERCLELLTEEQVWYKPNDASNAIANLILHLCGNMTQYVLSGLGGAPDLRERDKEFSTTGGQTKAALVAQLHSVVTKVCSIIEILDEPTLLQVRTVQGFQKTGIAIVLHVTEHMSYHTGQIALLTKLLTNQDLGFYKGLALNRKNG
ncbi:MAG: DinB family protein [Lacibacter sp.]